jgi:uncharacterized membrane protein
MSSLLHDVGRWLHLGSGFSAVALGAATMLMPKFGKWSVWHRNVGRVYATLIAGSCLLGIPLAYFRGSTYLMILGAFTLAVVLQGWVDGRAARSATARGDKATASRRLRWHLILMGSSYIGAWSGFFATNQVFGTGEWQIWLYVFGPPAVGGVLIARAAIRLGRRMAD